MSTSKSVIRINQDLCVGCGRCVTPCVGGAIELRDGKAHVISDDLCDGAGVCLDVCLHGALALYDRETGEKISGGMTDRMRTAVESVGQNKNQPATPPIKHGDDANCMMCGASENDVYLLRAAHADARGWVCVKCLPSLIHG